MEASQEIELEGHIIDSGIMTSVFDRIMDMGGNFEVTTFEIGKKKDRFKFRVTHRKNRKTGRTQCNSLRNTPVWSPHTYQGKY